MQINVEKFIENDKFRVQMHYKTKKIEHVYCNAYALELYHFHMNFYIMNLHLNFCYKVHTWIDYKCVSFQIFQRLLSVV
jgi:hypothetical protein